MDRTYYVICADGCKFESMTKEQILSAIEQAISTGEIKDVDTGFVTKIREKNKNAGLSFWVGTSAEYNALPTVDDDCFYILTDDTIGADIVAEINDIKSRLDTIGTAIIIHNERILDIEKVTTNKIIYSIPVGNKSASRTYGNIKYTEFGQFINIAGVLTFVDSTDLYAWLSTYIHTDEDLILPMGDIEYTALARYDYEAESKTNVDEVIPVKIYFDDDGNKRLDFVTSKITHSYTNIRIYVNVTYTNPLIIGG